MTVPPPDQASNGGVAPSDSDGEVLSEPVEALGSQDDFVHERVRLPEWIPVAFGLILVVIAVLAIWMA